jgi:hypothetical protein
VYFVLNIGEWLPLPPELNPLGLLLTHPGIGIDLVLAGGRTLHIAPIPLGFFPALFWTALGFFLLGAGRPRRGYRILLAYAVAATLFNAWASYQSATAVSSLVAFVTALFAGSAVAVWLASPLAALYAPPFRPPRAAGGLLFVGVPSSLILVFSLRSLQPFSLLMLGSLSLGLLAALQLISAGLLAPLRLSASALLVLSTALAILESVLFALLPVALRFVYSSA